MICPCCGQPTAERPDPRAVVEHLPINGQSRALVNALARRFGELVPTELLIDEVWSGVRDSGPTAARGCLSVIAYHTRKRIEPHGLTVRGQHSTGGYRLTWI